MGRQGYLFIVLGVWMPLFVLMGLYNIPQSPIYADPDWLWITQMYALFSGVMSILGLAFYVLARRR